MLLWRSLSVRAERNCLQQKARVDLRRFSWPLGASVLVAVKRFSKGQRLALKPTLWQRQQTSDGQGLMGCARRHRTGLSLLCIAFYP